MPNFIRFLLITLVLTTAAAPSLAAGKQPLTKVQVERFLQSFEVVISTVSEYWGDRRFTPRGKIMPPRGTIDRAKAEMKAAGKLQEFDRMFSDYGFGGYASWMTTGQRIANAQFELMAEQKGGPRLGFSPEQRKKLVAKRDALLAPNANMPESLRKKRLERYNEILADDDRWVTAKADKEAVRPYLIELQRLGRLRQQKAKAARAQSKIRR